MLQNRVDPFGNIIKTPERGAWLGNRGVLHNDKKEIVRPYKIKAWIICVLEFRGRHREVMQPGRWTELFFLDEATAFAAGHRPCFECRCDDANRFKLAWLNGNPEFGFDHKVAIGKIDQVMQEERIDKNRHKVTFKAAIKDLPDGTFVQISNKPYLLANNSIHLWTPAGYEKGQQRPKTKIVTVLTPRSTVNAFRAGYLPQTAL